MMGGVGGGRALCYSSELEKALGIDKMGRFGSAAVES